MTTTMTEFPNFNGSQSSFAPFDHRPPFEMTTEMDELSEQISRFSDNVKQKMDTLNKKLHLRDILYLAISPMFPMCGLYVVGSSLNGFGKDNSDLDLCLMITNRDIDQQHDAKVVLESIERTLHNLPQVVSQQLILAKVPILRITFGRVFSDIVVDLNANNSVAIRNTHLLCHYSSFDWRVRPLVAVIKEWAKRHGINDATRSSFTSYSLVLMVIHYLQCTDPPVLPSLHNVYPNIFRENADLRTLNVAAPLDPPPESIFPFHNKASLGELLVGFFQYYAFNFNFDADAISVRSGKRVERSYVAQNQSPYNHLSQWHCICIQEPFTLSNTAHSVYDERIFGMIKDSFVAGYQELTISRSLDSLLEAPCSEPATDTVAE